MKNKVDTIKGIWQNGQTAKEIVFMDSKTKTRLEARAKIFKAMAHPSRVLIVEELTEGERCVCDLTEKVGADISTVSKHLSVLKNAGLLLDEKRANQVFYRLRVPCILKFFDCVETVLEDLKKE